MSGHDTPLAVDTVAAAEVAAAHQRSPRMGGPFARAAYYQLSCESDRLFELMTGARRPVRIFFTMSGWPYRDADELITSIRRDRVLEVTTVARELDRLHPVMGCEVGGAYDRFRAVHDVLGHGYLDVGFDRDGEYAAWLFQERFHSLLARRALATELHGEHSVRWTTGDLPEHKAAILDERLIERSRSGPSAGRLLAMGRPPGGSPAHDARSWPTARRSQGGRPGDTKSGKARSQATATKRSSITVL